MNRAVLLVNVLAMGLCVFGRQLETASAAGDLPRLEDAKLDTFLTEVYGKRPVERPAWGDRGNEDVGYHIHEGKHDLTAYDWRKFMDFTDAHGWRNF